MTDSEILYTVDTGIEGAEEEDFLKITQSAFDEIHKISTENEVSSEYYLRFGIDGGGCTGVNYHLGFDSDIRDIDRTFVVNGVQIVIDSKSLFYFLGITLDFVTNDRGNGFIFKGVQNCPKCGKAVGNE